MNFHFLSGTRRNIFLAVFSIFNSLFRLISDKKLIRKMIIGGLESKTDRKVLIIHTLNLGDTIVSTPVYSALKSYFPNITIDILIKKQVAHVFDNNPNINLIYFYDESRLSETLDKIRKEKYFLTMDFFNSYTSLKRYFVAFRSGARYRIGFNNRFYIGFLNHISILWKIDAYNEVMNYFMILKALMPLPPKPEKLELYFSSDEEQSIDKLLQASCLGKFIIIHPCSQNARKLWSVEKFAELARKLTALGFDVAITGSDQNEAEYARRIIKEAKTKNTEVIDLTGRLTLRQWFLVIKKASLLISIDTSAIHVAAATGTPTVALFGPTNLTVWSPYNRRSQTVVTAGKCISCEEKFIMNEKCRFDDIVCMKMIHISKVYNAARRLLNAVK